MVYVAPRLTKSLDLVFAIDSKNLQAFHAAFAAFGFLLSDQAAADIATPNRMISIGRLPFRIDILNQIDGVDFQQAWAARNTI